MRLDHYLTLNGESLSIDLRLNLLRQIAETLRYAHEKRLVHRSLSPQSILIIDADGDSPKIKIFNWQVGFRKSGSSTRDVSRPTPTSHLEQLIEDAAMVYLAPEAINDPEIAGEQLDIFSLGTIAYHIFSARSPAENGLDLREKIPRREWVAHLISNGWRRRRIAGVDSIQHFSRELRPLGNHR